MTWNEAALRLVDVIEGSAEFRNLKQARALLDADPKLKNSIEEYKKKEKQILDSSRTGTTEALVAELSRAFEELAKIPEVQRFLKAEKEFGAFMQKTFAFIDELVYKALRAK